MSAKFFLLPLALLGLGAGVLLTRVMDARADPNSGLYFEETTSADGVTVRRLRDRSEDVVCYIAIGPQVGRTISYYGFVLQGKNVAISCWPAKSERQF